MTSGNEETLAALAMGRLVDTEAMLRAGVPAGSIEPRQLDDVEVECADCRRPMLLSPSKYKLHASGQATALCYVCAFRFVHRLSR